MKAKTQNTIKETLKNGDIVQLENTNSFFTIFLGHNNNFCLEMNCKVIKSTKTLQPILNKLKQLNAEILPF